MDRVEEIETAGLSPKEYRRIVRLLSAREGQRWDDQMDSDSSAGKLDFLFEEAECESAKGSSRTKTTIGLLGGSRLDHR